MRRLATGAVRPRDALWIGPHRPMFLEWWCGDTRFMRRHAVAMRPTVMVVALNLRAGVAGVAGGPGWAGADRDRCRALTMLPLLCLGCRRRPSLRGHAVGGLSAAGVRTFALGAATAGAAQWIHGAGVPPCVDPPRG